MGAAAASIYPSIAKAMSLPANVKTRSIQDVEHIVILTQENRSFDHYFGTMRGVRGFGDRFPIPVADNYGRQKNSVFVQPNENSQAPFLVAPFHFNTKQNFNHLRHQGTPHVFKDAQDAWDNGRLSNWPKAKHNHAMGYFAREDIQFQFALAESFTICDAYHCSMHGGTNPNRLYIWTGTINPDGTKNGPALDNSYDELGADPKNHGGYDWTTYPERLSDAGINWQIYQNMADNFTDNPVVGFKKFRAANKAQDANSIDLANKSIRTRDLDALKEDVISGKLPQVSWIIATAAGSEHPSSSTPAQGAQYTAKVLEALTANPDVWAKTIFLINFDENDGLFDHVPPPAVPAIDTQTGAIYGASNIDTIDEYHIMDDNYKNHAYGLGPRVPLYIISPWSKGGFVSSEVFDHTSIIRLIETRFGVHEPNISKWRRAVCGDLTSCFDFNNPNNEGFFSQLPPTDEWAARAKSILLHSVPKPPITIIAPIQETGLRPKLPTPYDLTVSATIIDGHININMSNQGTKSSAVLHIYNRNNLDALPHRFTIAPGKTIKWQFPIINNSYDLWILGPNGFHRHYLGNNNSNLINAEISSQRLRHIIKIQNMNSLKQSLRIKDMAYGAPVRNIEVSANEIIELPLNLAVSFNWYDIEISNNGTKLHLAGYIENGKVGYSDPAMNGSANLHQS